MIRDGSSPRSANRTWTASRFIRVTAAENGWIVTGDSEAWVGHMEPPIGRGDGQPAAQKRSDGRVPGGIGAGWRWHHAALEVANDRFGFAPLFWSISATDPRTLMLSDSLLRLLAEGADAEPDLAARRCFFCLGHYLDEETPYRAIRVLQPNATVRWDGARWRIDGRFHVPTAHEPDDSAAIDAYIELFAQSIRRRLADPASAMLLLTGGRDSRHILLELHRQGAAPALTLTCNPYPRIGDRQSAIAAELARRCGVAHEVVTPAEPLVAIDQRKNWRTGLLTDEATWAEMLLPRIAAGGGAAGGVSGGGAGAGDAGHPGAPIRAAYDGIAGDNLTESRYATAERLRFAERGDWGGLARAIVAGSVPDERSLWSLRRAVGGSFDAGRPIAAEIAERVEAGLARCADEPNPVARWYLRNRTRREIALGPYGVFAGVPNYYAPFLDHDFYDYFAGIPTARMLAMPNLHTRAIARAYPEFADVPYAQGGGHSRLSGSLVDMTSSLLRLAAFCARHRVGGLAGGVADTVRWTATRVVDRGGRRTMPRRFLQLAFQLEALDRLAADGGVSRLLEALGDGGASR